MIKIVLISIICGIICLYLKNIQSDLFGLCLIASGIIILFFSLSYLEKTVNFIQEIIDISGIDSSLYKMIFKITGIGLLVEFGAGILNDFNLTSLSNKLIFIGKVIILSISLPIFYSLLSIIRNLLEL